MNKVAKIEEIHGDGCTNDSAMCGRSCEIRVSVETIVNTNNACSQETKRPRNKKQPASGSERTYKNREKNSREHNLRQKWLEIPDVPEIRKAFDDLAKAIKAGLVTPKDIERLLANSDSTVVHQAQSRAGFFKMMTGWIMRLFSKLI